MHKTPAEQHVQMMMIPSAACCAVMCGTGARPTYVVRVSKDTAVHAESAAQPW